MTQALGWLTNIEVSGHLPICECVFDVGSHTVKGLINSDKARSLYNINGLVKINYDVNRSGDVIITNIEDMVTLFDHNQYITLISQLSSECIIWISDFLELNNNIKHPLLLPFVDFWRNNLEVLYLFFTVPASFQHHHSYKHGLLKHSVETARLSYQNALLLKLSDAECQVALVAGLFHDIGKIFPMQSHPVTPYIPSEHECQAWAVLSPILYQLAEKNYHWYQVFSDILRPHRDKSIVNRVESIVRGADRISADNDKTIQIFNSLPDYYYFARNDEKIYRRIN